MVGQCADLQLHIFAVRIPLLHRPQPLSMVLGQSGAHPPGDAGVRLQVDQDPEQSVALGLIRGGVEHRLGMCPAAPSSVVDFRERPDRAWAMALLGRRLSLRLQPGKQRRLVDELLVGLRQPLVESLFVTPDAIGADGVEAQGIEVILQLRIDAGVGWCSHGRLAHGDGGGGVVFFKIPWHDEE